MRSANATIALYLLAPLVAVAGLWTLATAGTPFKAPQKDWANGELAAAYEDQFDRAFPLRTAARNIWAALRYRLFAEGAPGLVVGEQGWFYTAQEFAAEPNAQHHLHSNLLWIAEVKQLLSRQGINLAVAVVPAKSRIYPEYLGRRQPAASQVQLYSGARYWLREHGVSAADLATELFLCKVRAQVYLKTDTHWTPAGADCAAQAISRMTRTQLALANLPPERYQRRSLGPVERRGDLMNYLPLAPLYAQLLPPKESLERYEVVAPVTADGNALLGEARDAPLALIGTSYSAIPLWGFEAALKFWTQVDVANLSTEGHGPFRPMARALASGELAALSPRLVIWEIPERYLLQPNPWRERGAQALRTAEHQKESSRS